MMNLIGRLKPTHLRLIVEIAKLQKLQLAANALNMSQPAASRVLSDIEGHVGSPLFIRHPRWMEETAVGQAFVRHARVILNELENLQREVQNLKTGKTGEVRVGAVTGPALGILMPAIKKVKENTPDIEATIEVGPSSQLVRELKEGSLDFVIARVPPEYDTNDFNIYPARDEDVALIAWNQHPLAGKSNIRLVDLLDYEWVVQERGTPIRQAIEEAFLGIGCPVPARVTNSSSLFVVLSLVTNSDSIAPLSTEVAELLTHEDLGANLTILNIDQSVVVSPYYIITNRYHQLTHAAEKILNEVLLQTNS